VSRKHGLLCLRSVGLLMVFPDMFSPKGEYPMLLDRCGELWRLQSFRHRAGDLANMAAVGKAVVEWRS
jgi:hypothetical protein